VELVSVPAARSRSSVIAASTAQQAKADHDFSELELGRKSNTELTRAIQVLTTELHRRVIGGPNK
jgi:hypothetical protein